MKRSILFPTLILLTVISLTSCDSILNGDDGDSGDSELPKTGGLIVEFRAKFNTVNLSMVLPYQNVYGDTFTVDELNYYVSNIVLERTGGEEYALPKDESYFLIRSNSVDDRTLELTDIPEGDYDGIRFLLGVDSVKSSADVSERTGDLDIVDNVDMYWSWNPGYIFFKMEGESPQAPEVNGKKRYRYHIGGFGYNNPDANNLREVRVPFQNFADIGFSAKVRQGEKRPFVILGPNVAKLFDGPNAISIKENPTIMNPTKSSEIADNISQMFEFNHLHNY